MNYLLDTLEVSYKIINIKPSKNILVNYSLLFFRVLCFGGTVVLLLNQELYKCISNYIAHGSQTERSILAESSTDCRQSNLISAEQDIKQESISCGTVSPSSQDTREEHLSYKKADLGSLVFIESFEVSLGKTNAFICKYKKIT